MCEVAGNVVVGDAVVGIGVIEAVLNEVVGIDHEGADVILGA